MKKNKYSNKFPTLTVAVCAYNEGANIANFLNSVLKQKERGYTLKKVIVISDGSTDDTLAKIRKFKTQKIRLVVHNNRKGKSARLNEIYQNLTTDFLFQSDADVILAGKLVLARMLKVLIDPKVAMVSGNAEPYSPKTLMERAIHVSRNAYHPLKTTFKEGNNRFSVNGRILAYRSTFVKSVVIPNGVIGNDAFTYFACLQRGLSYRYAEDAIAHYRSPMTLYDHVKQNTRFLAVSRCMKEYFPKELVAREYALPIQQKFYLLSLQFMKHPILSIFIFTINRYCQILGILQSEQMHGPWNISESTKK